MWVEIKGMNFNYHVFVLRVKLWDAFVEFKIMHCTECFELWGSLQAQCTKSPGNYCEGDNFN
jgi:hypothetical protein